MILTRSTLTTLLLLTAALSFSSVHADPVCLTDSDLDGDGWGWENSASCRIVGPATTNTQCIDSDGDGYGWDGTTTCTVGSQSTVSQSSGQSSGQSNVLGSGICVDSDGDGYGWDGTATCEVNPVVASSSACIDSDGDGYGWDGTTTCQVASVAATSCIDTDGDGYGWDGTTTCTVGVTPPPSGNPTDVTDVILMMGQSNALGENTQVDLNQDSVDSRVIVWTQFNGWQIGNLCTQKWQKAWFPWRGGLCSNHPAFQIAKHIVELDGSRKVAVIPTGSAGKPIRWWDANGIADALVNATVQTALGSLGKSQVDLIAWSQGEADHGNESAWKLKLDDLISRLRQRPWFDASQGQFIAQETKWSSVNSKVRELGTDGDPLTDWVQASDQPTKDGVHWSAAALRVISERFANEYIN